MDTRHETVLDEAMASDFGSSDCERIREGFLRQPVNALTSLAFLPAGILVALRRPDRREMAAAICSVGVGSFLAHGPGGTGSHWLHDVTIGWVLAAIGLEDEPRWVRWTTYAAIGTGFALAPSIRKPASALAAILTVARLVVGRRYDPPALALAATGALIGRLSRTGGPLCHPERLLQGHGAWHVLAAASLARFGVVGR